MNVEIILLSSRTNHRRKRGVLERPFASKSALTSGEFSRDDLCFDVHGEILGARPGAS